MVAVKKVLLRVLIISMLAWLLATVVHAAPIIVNDTLSGQLLFPGWPQRNPDGSITYQGVTYIGTATGTLPGRWGMILSVTYPPDSTTGQATGGWAVGTLTDNVYGMVDGVMDPTAGTFELLAAVVGGSGAYAGMTGAGSFGGDLVNSSIEGTLAMVLFPAAGETTRRPAALDQSISRALLLMQP